MISINEIYTNNNTPNTNNENQHQKIIYLNNTNNYNNYYDETELHNPSYNGKIENNINAQRFNHIENANNANNEINLSSSNNGISNKNEDNNVSNEDNNEKYKIFSNIQNCMNTILQSLNKQTLKYEDFRYQEQEDEDDFYYYKNNKGKLTDLII